MEDTQALPPFPDLEAFGSSLKVDSLEPGVAFVKTGLTPDQQRWLVQYAMFASGVLGEDGKYNLEKETKFWTVVDGQRKFNSAYTRGRIYEALHKLPETQTLLEIITRIRAVDPVMPDCNPTHLLLLYYAAHHGMGYHADNGENDGDNDHPIISISLGNSCEFGMRLKNGEKKIILASGDIIVWGGPKRMLSHSVLGVKSRSAPKFLGLNQEVRFNFTFRDAPNILGREDEFAKYDAKAESQARARKAPTKTQAK